MARSNENGLTLKPRVKKEDWLHCALDILEKKGIDSVRVEHMAAKLGVSKSGFYYHFRDRNDLCDALLNHWENIDHLPILQNPPKLDATPFEMLSETVETAHRENLDKYDQAIRLWAKQDPKVRRVWQKVMDKRTNFVRHIFAAAGFTGGELEMRTRLFLVYHIEERDLFPDLTKQERGRLRDARLKLLLSPILNDRRTKPND